MKIKFCFTILIFLITTSVKAVTFNKFYELNQCVDNYNSFAEYKINLQKCFKNKNVILEENYLKVIYNRSDIIDSIIEINYNLNETKKKSLIDIFFTNNEKTNNLSIDNKSFKKLNRYIKKNPKDIYALTEDINKLTYDDKIISEFNIRI